MIHLKFTSLILVGLMFLALGIQVLMAAYRLDDPFSFVLTFFAANFIILISATLVVGFLLRLLHLRKTGNAAETPPSEKH